MSERVADALRRLGYEVVTTRQAGNKGWRDPQQLAFAVRHGYVFVTCNRNDFSLLHESWLICAQLWGYTGDLHPGILVVPPSSEERPERVGELIDGLVRTGRSLTDRLLRWELATGWGEA